MIEYDVQVRYKKFRPNKRLGLFYEHVVAPLTGVLTPHPTAIEIYNPSQTKPMFIRIYHKIV